MGTLRRIPSTGVMREARALPQRILNGTSPPPGPVRRFPTWPTRRNTTPGLCSTRANLPTICTDLWSEVSPGAKINVWLDHRQISHVGRKLTFCQLFFSQKNLLQLNINEANYTY